MNLFCRIFGHIFPSIDNDWVVESELFFGYYQVTAEGERAYYLSEQILNKRLRPCKRCDLNHGLILPIKILKAKRISPRESCGRYEK